MDRPNTLCQVAILLCYWCVFAHATGWSTLLLQHTYLAHIPTGYGVDREQTSNFLQLTFQILQGQLTYLHIIPNMESKALFKSHIFSKKTMWKMKIIP